MASDSITTQSTTGFIEGVKDALRNGSMLVICTKCEVEYDGRAAGYLGIGDRMVISKPDGTLLVHRPRDRDPVNWQPPGSTISITESEDDIPVLKARRTNPDESVQVYLHDIYSCTEFAANDVAPLELEGTEADMHEFIEANPTEIEEGLRIIEHERDTPFGSMDFFANDSEGRPVIIEVKRGRANLTHVDQLKRYVSLYRESNPDARGVLVAPTASEKVERTLRENDLEFVDVDAFSQSESNITSTTFADFDQE